MSSQRSRAWKSELLPRILADVGRESGMALVATILVLMLGGIITAVAISSAMTSLRTASLDSQDAQTFYAAEAAGEAAIAALDLAVRDGVITDDELDNITPPSLPGYDFTGFGTKKTGTVHVEKITDGPFAGLNALTEDLEIVAPATDKTGTHNAVVLSVKAQAIPIFQFGVFYEEDLEIHPGPPMDFLGRVHTNGRLYLNANEARFHEMLTTPKTMISNYKHKVVSRDGVWIMDDNANLVQLLFDSRSIPDPEQFKARSHADFDDRVQTDAYGVEELKLPLPATISSHEIVRPKESGDGPQERETKLAWLSDMYTTIDLSDIRTKGEVCGSGVNTPPDNAVGEVLIVADGPVCAGSTVKFQASHPDLACSEFDSRAILTIDADAWVQQGPMNGCEFSATLPADTAADFKIKVEIESDYYAQLSDDVIADYLWDKSTVEACKNGGFDNTPWPSIDVSKPFGGSLPSAKEKCDIFQWNWEAFVDSREKKPVDILDVDIAQLRAWINADPTNRGAKLIYVEFIPSTAFTKTSGSDPTGDGYYAALRMKNGSQLPGPLTIGTDYPLYVWGDFNTINKQPSSVAGDAYHVLSNAWDDNAHKILREANGAGLTNATPTTINTALLSGHSATTCDINEDPGCNTAAYGGGFENLPRFIENWSNVEYRFRGSIVILWQAKLALGTWYRSSADYYKPPVRNWGFDLDLLDPAKMPPGTPVVGSVIKTAFRDVY